MSLTYSNVYLSQRASLRSWGICHEAPYVASLLEKHKREEAAVKRKIAEIRERYNQLKGDSK